MICQEICWISGVSSHLFDSINKVLLKYDSMFQRCEKIVLCYSLLENIILSQNDIFFIPWYMCRYFTFILFRSLWTSGSCLRIDHIQIAIFMGPTWGPPGSCRSQVGPRWAPWTLLSGWPHGSVNNGVCCFPFRGDASLWTQFSSIQAAA